MEVVSIFAGVRYYSFLRKKDNDTISHTNRLIIFAAVCLGALIGSRLIGILEQPFSFLNSQNKFIYIFSNKTIVGGLLGGLLSVEITKKIIGVTASSGDIMTYPLLLGLILGRVGCFCEGLSDGTIGKATSLFTGIDFGDGTLRHPLPLYEIVFLITLWISIRVIQKKGLADGARFKLFLISYLMYRFGIEFLKEEQFTLFRLSVIQLTCLAGLLYYLPVILKPKKLFLHHA
jgi:phosphatidylglycerol---prolipoprotein diacylglyceryl transferase